MSFIDRLFVAFATLFVGLFLVSLFAFEAAFALPVCGVLYVVLGGKRK